MKRGPGWSWAAIEVLEGVCCMRVWCCYTFRIKWDMEITIQHFNIVGPRQNGRHFPDDIFKCIFLKENVWISISISLKFIPKFRINNIPVLVQIMAWRRPGDKPLSELIRVSLLAHICVTRPQWVLLLTYLNDSLWPETFFVWSVDQVLLKLFKNAFIWHFFKCAFWYRQVSSSRGVADVKYYYFFVFLDS